MKKYCCDLRQHIKKNYIPITHNKVGTVEFHLVIDRSGDILLIEQISSSKDDFLDNYAKETIINSFPFKEFYEEDTLQTYLDIIIPIEFKGDVNGSNVD